MNDAAYGTRDKRGDWRPSKLIEYPPVLVWPVRPVAFVKWLFGFPGYILPWNLFYGAFSVVLWLYLTPAMATMKTFSVGWIGYLLVRNAVLLFLFCGAFHLRLYMQKRQGVSFKFNGKWPSTGNSAFLFGNQTTDNMIWTFASAVPIWTAYEVLTLWVFANGYIRASDLLRRRDAADSGIPQPAFLSRASADPRARAVSLSPQAAP